MKGNKFEKQIDILFIVMGLAAISLYVYNYFRLPGILHFEVPLDTANFMSGGMHGMKDMLHKVFNLTMIEGGLYRPRIGAFIIQYCDIKAWNFLNEHIAWGGHYPFILLAVPLYVYGVQLWLKGIFPKLKSVYRFCLGGGYYFYHIIKRRPSCFLEVPK